MPRSKSKCNTSERDNVAWGESVPESPFWAPIPENCIAPGVDCKTKGSLAPKEPAFATDGPGDLLSSMPWLPHRESSKSIVPTFVPPLSSYRWYSARRHQPISLQEAATSDRKSAGSGE